MSVRRAWKLSRNRTRRLARLVHFGLLVVAGHERTILGVSVVTAEDPDGVPLMPKVRRALHLIKTYDPDRFKKLRGDLSGGIQVTELRFRTAWFESDTLTCHLDMHYVRDMDCITDIALSVVHEAKHAQLCKAGFGYEEHVREQVERICITSEHAFRSKLPCRLRGATAPLGTLDRISALDYTDEGFDYRARLSRRARLRFLLNHSLSKRAIRLAYASVAFLGGNFRFAFTKKWEAD